MNKGYQALYICRSSGRTYWHTYYDSVPAVKKHLDRHLRKPSDVFIYQVTSDPIVFVQKILDYKKGNAHE